MSVPKRVKIEIPMAVQLAPTDVLVAELAHRSEAMIFSMRYRPLEEDTRTVEDFRINGDMRVCQGLACGVIDKIDETIRVRKEEDGDVPEEWER